MRFDDYDSGTERKCVQNIEFYSLTVELKYFALGEIRRRYNVCLSLLASKTDRLANYRVFNSHHLRNVVQISRLSNA